MFDTETETWSEEGVMKVPRGRPGASVVSLDEVKEWATDCVTKEIPSKFLHSHHIKQNRELLKVFFAFE